MHTLAVPCPTRNRHHPSAAKLAACSWLSLYGLPSNVAPSNASVSLSRTVPRHTMKGIDRRRKARATGSLSRSLILKSSTAMSISLFATTGPIREENPKEAYTAADHAELGC